MLEKLGGVVTIVVAFALLYLISVAGVPTFVKIIGAFIGAVICLIGIVIVFAEGSILEERWGKKVPKMK